MPASHFNNEQSQLHTQRLSIKRDTIRAPWVLDDMEKLDGTHEADGSDVPRDTEMEEESINIPGTAAA